MGEGVESVGHNQIKTMATPGSFFGHIEPCLNRKKRKKSWERELHRERETYRERDSWERPTGREIYRESPTERPTYRETYETCRERET